MDIKLNTPMNTPIKLEPTRAWRTYNGGKMLDILHGVEEPADSHFPEEWIISTVAARNPGREEFTGEGLSRLEGSGFLLTDLIASCPTQMLGTRHVNAVGENMGVLVKLLDAAERLTVQVHPDKEHAMKLLGSKFGKTECWHIIDGRTVNGEPPHVYLGFKPGITRERWKSLFEIQDVKAMLDCLHKLYVKPGETYLVEGGVPHAIGAGCFMVEIQEPTDYTIRFERVMPSGGRNTDEMCHLGMGFEGMYDCFRYEGFTKEQALAKWKIERREIKGTCECKSSIEYEAVGYKDTSCFRLTSADIDPGRCYTADNGSVLFSGLYILAGAGRLEALSLGIKAGALGLENTCKAPAATKEYMSGLDIKQGDQFFVPASAAGYRIKNTGAGVMKILRFFGPDTEQPYDRKGK